MPTNSVRRTPNQRRTSGLPDVAAAARRRPQEQLLPAPATIEGATSRTIPCQGTGTVATTPRRCASVDGGLGSPYVHASLCRLPRGRLVLLLLRARIAGVADRRLTTARRRPLASGRRRALLRLLVSSPAAAEGEKGEHGTAPVHRSNDDRGALFFDEERLLVLLSLSHACFVFCPGFVAALLGKTRYNCVRTSRK